MTLNTRLGLKYCDSLLNAASLAPPVPPEPADEVGVGRVCGGGGSTKQALELLSGGKL